MKSHDLMKALWLKWTATLATGGKWCGFSGRQTGGSEPVAGSIRDAGRGRFVCRRAGTYALKLRQPAADIDPALAASGAGDDQYQPLSAMPRREG